MNNSVIVHIVISGYAYAATAVVCVVALYILIRLLLKYHRNVQALYQEESLDMFKKNKSYIGYFTWCSDNGVYGGFVLFGIAILILLATFIILATNSAYRILGPEYYMLGGTLWLNPLITVSPVTG